MDFYIGLFRPSNDAQIEGESCACRHWNFRASDLGQFVAQML